MITRVKTWLFAFFAVALFGGIALSQEAPRVPLDWEPDPNYKSQPVYRCINGRIRVVYLIGGKEIRRRVPSAQ